jgi:hypothetical protein
MWALAARAQPRGDPRTHGAAAQKERKMYSVVWKGLFAAAVIGAAPSAFADVITDWNDTAAAVVRPMASFSNTGLYMGARIMGIVRAAMFDAVNSIERCYRPYVTQLPANPATSKEAAAAAAVAAVLATIDAKTAGEIVRIQIHDVRGIGAQTIRPRPTIFDQQIDTLFPTQLRWFPFESGHPASCFGFLFGKSHEHANASHLIGPLRPRHDRPGRRACKPRNELPPSHSITSQARTSNGSGIVSPSALAVLRLTVISTRVDCCMGRSDGFAPFRIRPT